LCFLSERQFFSAIPVHHSFPASYFDRIDLNSVLSIYAFALEAFVVRVSFSPKVIRGSLPKNRGFQCILHPSPFFSPPPSVLSLPSPVSHVPFFHFISSGKKFLLPSSPPTVTWAVSEPLPFSPIPPPLVLLVFFLWQIIFVLPSISLACGRFAISFSPPWRAPRGVGWLLMAVAHPEAHCNPPLTCFSHSHASFFLPTPSCTIEGTTVAD